MKVVTSKDVQNIRLPRTSNTLYEQGTEPHSFQRKPSRTAAAKIQKIKSTHDAKTPFPRRSDRLHKLRAQAGAYAIIVVQDPRTPKEALSGPHDKEWEAAMLQEIVKLIENGTWELVEKPADVNMTMLTSVGHKWVFKIKFDSSGEIERFKARLVAQGFSQRYGVDFTETFSPVIQQQRPGHPDPRALMQVLVLYQDVPQEYVKSTLDTPVYMSVPALVDGDAKTQALKLIKSLYGLKQSGRM